MCHRELQNGPHVLWLDNWPKTYASSVQGVQGAYKSCLWMGRGIKKYVGAPVELKGVNIPPGLPKTLFTKTRVSSLQRAMKGLDEKGWSYDESYCTAFKIQTVPPKRQPCPVEEPELHALLEEHRDGITNFHPCDILDLNPGKNADLVRYFREYHFDILMSDPELPQQIVMCDVNIYHRLMKVTKRIDVD